MTEKNTMTMMNGADAFELNAVAEAVRSALPAMQEICQNTLQKVDTIMNLELSLNSADHNALEAMSVLEKLQLQRNKVAILAMAATGSAANDNTVALAA